MGTRRPVDGDFEDGGLVALEVGLDALEAGDGFVEAGELLFDFGDDAALILKSHNGNLEVEQRICLDRCDRCAVLRAPLENTLARSPNRMRHILRRNSRLWRQRLQVLVDRDRELGYCYWERMRQDSAACDKQYGTLRDKRHAPICQRSLGDAILGRSDLIDLHVLRRYPRHRSIGPVRGICLRWRVAARPVAEVAKPNHRSRAHATNSRFSSSITFGNSAPKS